MQMPDLAKAYQTKTDEELLQLASDSARLTPKAHAILRSELAGRRIDVPQQLTAQEESDQGRSEQPRTRGTLFIRAVAFYFKRSPRSPVGLNKTNNCWTAQLSRQFS